jgi:hypothetical protein
MRPLRNIAQRELASAKGSAERIAELEHYRDEGFVQFALLASERLADLSSEDKHQTYKY